nr:N-acetyltransferase 6 isoform X2 [Pogona vitticeps]
MGSVSEVLTVVPLHQRPDLLEACADLINEEWKRSRTSRMHSLQRSADNFPMCLVLIRTQRPGEEMAEGKMTESQAQLLGHARLSRVVGQPKSLFVETVVVAKALRGKGYGRKLMEAVENYAKSRGYQHLHLTTHDKQHFYAHLGYTLSKPVQCAGFVSSLVPMDFLESFSPPQHERGESAGSEALKTMSFYSSRSGTAFPPLPHHCSPSSFVYSRCPPPPPSPLPPASPSHRSFSQPINASVQPMPHSDCTHAIPPPPPPPPPPVPLSSGLSPAQPDPCKATSSGPSENKTQGQTFLETPYRDLKGQPVFWMEKAI